jgi:predicted small lipoprotein YifL
MKKSLSPLFAVVVALALAACGEKKDTTPPAEQPKPEPVAAEPTPSRSQRRPPSPRLPRPRPRTS